MQVKAAMLRATAAPPYVLSRPLDIVDVDLDGPGRGEVLVQIAAAGLAIPTSR